MSQSEGEESPNAVSGEVWTRERCFISEILNHKNNPGVSLALCRVPPGITTQLHRLSVSEWYLMRSGIGWLELNEQEPRELCPEQNILIPAMTPQRITNRGSQDLRFYCLCQPRFTPDCYEALE